MELTIIKTSRIMNHREKLEREIRSKIPRLMELTEGCKLKSSYPGVAREEFKNIQILAVANMMKGEDIFYIKDRRLNRVANLKRSQLVSEYEIIGHEIRLSDVLEWIMILGKDWLIKMDGSICGWNSYSCLEESGIKIPLSKPFSEWDEEIIEFLYKLIKK